MNTSQQPSTELTAEALDSAVIVYVAWPDGRAKVWVDDDLPPLAAAQALRNGAHVIETVN